MFISWSKDRSRRVAEGLAEFLADVIQGVIPFVSAHDIAAGSRWAIDLPTELEETDVGVLCLTPENISSPWILFEAGALSKKLDRSKVCPYLLDLKPSDPDWPLAQFQASLADESGTKSVIATINATLADHLR